MGGYQRLALDQAYCFASLGHEVNLISLSELPKADKPNFIVPESSLISKYAIDIKSYSGNRFTQFRCIRKLLRQSAQGSVIVSHSLRATVLLALIRRTLPTKFQIHTTIHQIPGLSHLAQRKRRFIYAQFSDFLYGYSNAVLIDWRIREKHESILYKLGISKEIELLRNGVFIPRIPEYQLSTLVNQRSRLIYIGRSTHWKGISEFINIARNVQLVDFDVLILMPEFDQSLLSGLGESMLKRFVILEGKTVANIVRVPGDVHIYPTRYGDNIDLIEGISLNCIEMACMGIPSVISENGSSTWPEKVLEGVFTETDWMDSDLTVTRILSASSMSMGLVEAEVDAIRDLFTVMRQIPAYLTDKV
jgi:glycosyltransferase involved in cell wall biosynthesis